MSTHSISNPILISAILLITNQTTFCLPHAIHTVFFPTLQQYMQPDTTMFVQLEKTLYGLREAGKMWFDLLSMALINVGFQQCMHELPLFKRKNHEIISIHVDDLLITYSGNLDIRN